MPSDRVTIAPASLPPVRVTRGGVTLSVALRTKRRQPIFANLRVAELRLRAAARVREQAVALVRAGKDLAGRPLPTPSPAILAKRTARGVSSTTPLVETGALVAAIAERQHGQVTRVEWTEQAGRDGSKLDALAHYAKAKLAGLPQTKEMRAELKGEMREHGARIFREATTGSAGASRKSRAPAR